MIFLKMSLRPHGMFYFFVLLIFLYKLKIILNNT